MKEKRREIFGEVKNNGQGKEEKEGEGEHVEDRIGGGEWEGLERKQECG